MNMISKSKRMQEIFHILPDIARSESSVLIEGESGTGKELLARAIHQQSFRKEGPLVTVNCGAIPDSLLESELFGYVAGAFTDAKRDKPGRFAMAEGGTIFLDEIGDVSPALQVRLLRVLQEKTFEPLGGTRSLKADVRVIAATNRDLAREVEEKRFRSDLFYRINVIRIVLPPLRERREDLPMLTEHIIGRMNAIHGKQITEPSSEVMAAFLQYDWPGSIRELENVLEHAFVLCPGGTIECRHLPDTFPCSGPQHPSPPTGQTMSEVEARAIHDALVRNNWNRSAAARELGIDKTTVWRKCKRLGIVPPTDFNN